MHFNGDDAKRLQQRGFITPREPVLRVALDDTIVHPFVRMLDCVRAQSVGF